MNVLIASLMLAVAVAKVPETNLVTVRGVSRTPEPDTALLVIAIPKGGEVLGTPVWVQFRIDGYSLGTSSQFERASEIAGTEMGQTVHVVIDNHPYFPVNAEPIAPFEEGGFYYQMSYKFEIPFRLKEGMHTIRMFPARSFGESLKGERTFAAMNFFVDSRKENPNIDLSQPYLTYNEPSAQMDYVEGKPILLDFYLTNVELSPDGYKVRLTIDGKVNRMLTSWQPFYLSGLKAGSHKIRLELLDGQNKLVPGFFNDVTQSITVQRP